MNFFVCFCFYDLVSTIFVFVFNNTRTQKHTEINQHTNKERKKQTKEGKIDR